ncbi:Uncharacterised protein [Raoultella ornithinolytica]|nr:Uncharacterised protein [Raoultella ornithinolytica]
MQIVALIVALAAPNDRVRIAGDQAFNLQVQLTQAKLRIVIEGGFVIVRTVRDHADHAIEIEADVILLIHLRTQLQLAIGIRFVTQTTNFVFLPFGQTAIPGDPNPGTHITMKINSRNRGGSREHGW